MSESPQIKFYCPIRHGVPSVSVISPSALFAHIREQQVQLATRGGTGKKLYAGVSVTKSSKCPKEDSLRRILKCHSPRGALHYCSEPRGQDIILGIVKKKRMNSSVHYLSDIPSTQILIDTQKLWVGHFKSANFSIPVFFYFRGFI